MEESLPGNLQAVLWSRDVRDLNLKKDQAYIVHQVLAYGTWEHLKWLLAAYPRSEIIRVFTGYPSKDYTAAAYHFVKNVLLDLTGATLDERKYVRSYPRLSQ